MQPVSGFMQPDSGFMQPVSGFMQPSFIISIGYLQENEGSPDRFGINSNPRIATKFSIASSTLLLRFKIDTNKCFLSKWN